MAKMLLLVCAGLALLAIAPAASATPSPIVAVTDRTIFLQDGTVVTQQTSHDWTNCTNVFVSAGVAPGTVAGASGDHASSWAVVDSQGNVYGGGGPCGWSFRANIFTATGQPVAEIAGMQGGGSQYTVATKEGNVFFAYSDLDGWQYLGNALAGTVLDAKLNPGALGLAVRPNPSRNELAATFSLATLSDVRMEVLDAQGRIVASSGGAVMAPGAHSLKIGRDSDGKPLAPGTYFVRVTAGGRSAVSKAVLIR